VTIIPASVDVRQEERKSPACPGFPRFLTLSEESLFSAEASSLTQRRGLLQFWKTLRIESKVRSCDTCAVVSPMSSFQIPGNAKCGFSLREI
jgi:hypothetical protein